MAQLKADESLQFYVDARPVNLEELLGELPARSGGRARAERRARSARRAISWRWRSGGCTPRWRSHCACTPTRTPRCRCAATSVVPLLPRQNVARAALAWARRAKLPTVPLERPVEAHRRAVREHLAHVDSLRGELEAEGMPTELLDGEQVVRLLWERFNPGKADSRPAPVAPPWRCSASWTRLERP